MTGFFLKKFMQFFQIKILAGFSKKIAKSIEFTLQKTNICIFFPIFFQKNHCLMLIHLRGPFFLSLEKEGGLGRIFFFLVQMMFLKVFPKFVKHFTLTTY